MDIIQKITLDFANGSRPPTVFAKQYDKDSRTIEITPMNDRAPYYLDSELTARIQMTKPDNTTVLADCVINDTKISVTLPEQALTAVGTAVAEIGLYDSDELLTSQVFYIEIQKGAYNINAPESSDAYPALMKALADVKAAEEKADDYTIEALAALESKMDLPLVEVPTISGATAPDTTSTEYIELSDGQMFKCYITGNLTYWIKYTAYAGTPAEEASPIHLARYDEVPHSVTDLSDGNDYPRAFPLPVTKVNLYADERGWASIRLSYKPPYRPGDILYDAGNDYDNGGFAMIVGSVYQNASGCWVTGLDITFTGAATVNPRSIGTGVLNGTLFWYPDAPNSLIAGELYLKTGSGDQKANHTRIALYNDLSGKMDLPLVEVPAASGQTAPDTSDPSYTALPELQMFQCHLSGNLTFWVKFTMGAGTPGETPAPIRIALYDDISALASIVGNANDLLEAALNYQAEE